MLHLITLIDTYTLCKTPLHERSARRKDRQQTPIRTRDPSKKDAADPRLRPLGSAVVFILSVILYLTISGPASFRETCQWLKFPLNVLRAQSMVSPVVGWLP